MNICPSCGAWGEIGPKHICTNAPRLTSIPEIPIQSCTLCEPYGAGMRCTGRCDPGPVETVDAPQQPK